MRRVGTSVAVMTLAIFLALPEGEATHGYDSRPHWKGESVTASVRVLDSVTSKWDAALRDAAADWSLNPDVELNVVKSSTKRRKRKKCAPAEEAIHVCNYNYGTSWAGLAEIDFNNNGHVLRGRVRLNDTTPNGLTPAVACHELGHTLGLGHYSDPQPPDSCMATPARPGGPEDPSAHDQGEVSVNHGHVDSFPTTTSGGSAGGATYDRSDPNITVEEFDGFTRVTWVLYTR